MPVIRITTSIPPEECPYGFTRAAAVHAARTGGQVLQERVLPAQGGDPTQARLVLYYPPPGHGRKVTGPNLLVRRIGQRTNTEWTLQNG